MSLQKIPFLLSIAILAVTGIVILRVAAQADTTAPVISGITVSAITQNSATITWTTDEAADTYLEHRLPMDNIHDVESITVIRSDEKTTAHTVTITNMTPGATYIYFIQSKDAAGNAAQSQSDSQTFTTLASGDASSVSTASHVISNITVTDITQTSATIRWQTAEPAGSYVDFWVNGTRVDLYNKYEDHTTTHSLTIYGRLPGTTYHYRVISGDTGLYYDPTNPPRKAISDSPDQIFTTLSSSASSVSSQSSSATVANCTTNADCNILWFGATSCRNNNLTQLSNGFCDTSSGICTFVNSGPVCGSTTCYDYRTKEDCAASGKICAFVDFTSRCTSSQLPPACSINTPITAPCLCSSSIMSYGYCCGTSWVLNGCPTSGSLAPSSSPPKTASQALIVPTTSPSQPTITSTPTPPVVPSIQPTTTPLVTAPKLSPNIPKAQTGSTAQKTLRKLSPQDVKKWQLDLRRELRKFERFLLKQGKTAFVSQVGDIREELYDLDPDDPLAGKAIQNLQEELAELRLIADAVPLTGQGTVLKSGSSSSTRIAVAPPSPQPAVTPKVPAVPLFSKETSIAITYPPEGSTLRGFTNIDVILKNASEASGLQFQVDGVNSGGDENGKPPYGKLWYTIKVANGTHELRVMAWDAQGNTVTSKPVQVTVQNVPDSVPPTMSVPKVTAVTRTTATIQWTTDKPVGTSMRYNEDLGGGYGRNYGAIHNYREKTTQHEVTLTGLNPGTTYSYSVSVTDDAGNNPVREKFMGLYEGTYAARYRRFTTLSNSPLVIFNFLIEDVTETSATIAWTTSVPADSEVQMDANSGLTPFHGGTFVTSHAITLTGLKPGYPYSFRVISRDRSGNVAQYPASFNTQAIPDEEPTIVLHVFRDEKPGVMNPLPFWPGTKAYFTMETMDDSPFRRVRVLLTQHKKGGGYRQHWDMTLSQCSGQTSCAETKHAFIVPEELGDYMIYVQVEERLKVGAIGHNAGIFAESVSFMVCPVNTRC